MFQFLSLTSYTQARSITCAELVNQVTEKKELNEKTWQKKKDFKGNVGHNKN